VDVIHSAPLNVSAIHKSETNFVRRTRAARVENTEKPNTVINYATPAGRRVPTDGTEFNRRPAAVSARFETRALCRGREGGVRDGRAPINRLNVQFVWKRVRGIIVYTTATRIRR